MDKIIEATGVVKTYSNGVTGLNGLNLSICPGEMVGVLGASGSGKTTLFRLLNGSISPTHGEISVLRRSLNNLPYASLRELRSKIAFIPQHHSIIPGLTVAQNVLMGKLGKVSPLQALRMSFFQTDSELQMVYEALAKLGLADKMFQRAVDLSGGQQQRVAIARALVSEAEIILADEPIASVDYVTAESILNLFKEINRTYKTTIIMNLHQQDFALEFCSRIIALNKGTVIYDGPPTTMVYERGEVHATG